MLWKPRCRRCSRGYGCLLAALLSCGFLIASCTQKHLTTATSGQFATPEECGHCHVAISEEWTASPHAQAYVNPRFRAATDEYRFSQCIGCHAPVASYTSGTPAARDSQRELGVTCVSCHLKDGAMVGPQQPTGKVKPHPISVEPGLFEEGRLCGRCHQGELAQWNASPVADKQDCGHCHMPAVTRKMTQSTSAISRVFVAMEKPGLEHRHSFELTPTDPGARRITLDIVPQNGRAEVILINQLPHNLPTGDFGVRLVTVELSALDAAGASTPLDRREFASAGGKALASGQRQTWSVAIPAGSVALRGVVSRQGRDGASAATLLERQIQLTPLPASAPVSGGRP